MINEQAIDSPVQRVCSVLLPARRRHDAQVTVVVVRALDTVFLLLSTVVSLLSIGTEESPGTFPVFMHSNSSAARENREEINSPKGLIRRLSAHVPSIFQRGFL